MIPDIGIMIGAYIITKMLALLSRCGDGAANIVTGVFACLTIVVTVISLIDLITQGAKIAKKISPLMDMF